MTVLNESKVAQHRLHLRGVGMFRNDVTVHSDNPAVMRESEEARFRGDRAGDIFMDQRGIDQERLAEEANRAPAVGEADERRGMGVRSCNHTSPASSTFRSRRLTVA